MKRRFWLYPSIITGIFLIFLVSCKKDTSNIFPNTMTDYDGNVYHTIQIGTQTWMVENLITTHYRNGDSIANVQDSVQWGNQSNGAYCFYADSIYNKINYGLLYNWYAASDTGIAPKGFHVAADSDWNKLIAYLGGDSIAGSKMRDLDTTFWYSPNIAYNDTAGFAALPCGYRAFDTAVVNAFQYYGLNYKGYWWSTTSLSNGYASAWHISGDSLGIYHDSLDYRFGLGVRCVKN